MLRSGPIPLFIHGLIEYIAAFAFIVAPFVLGFESDAATYLSIAVGVVVLIIAAITEGPTSLVNQLPIMVHVLLDYALALFLIAAPFLFDFSEENEPTAWFITLGVVHLLLTIATRFLRDEGTPRRGRRSRSKGVGALARGTSVDIEAGEHTVLDDPKP